MSQGHKFLRMQTQSRRYLPREGLRLSRLNPLNLASASEIGGLLRVTVCLPSLWLFRLGLKVMKTPFSQALYVMTLENRRLIAVSVQVTQSSCCTSQCEEPEAFRGCFSLNPSSSCPHEGNTQTTTIRSKTPSPCNRSGIK